ncbi:mRNA degradation protein, mitochondrial [Tolypocladium ophioglossoides CBS 100239]|uniref:mRNA degradation protein, mitochondrial n=1 Tax=Tolypocladium ophioglossoides (strain CBS 100239) TaxID=1163406 RepID=A0A0L0NIQ7_TOLOC|nr:mRNA degradation protein, mitochondrial [Tolypocladium ophioglossoides CBS 100239]
MLRLRCRTGQLANSTCRLGSQRHIVPYCGRRFSATSWARSADQSSTPPEDELRETTGRRKSRRRRETQANKGNSASAKEGNARPHPAESLEDSDSKLNEYLRTFQQDVPAEGNNAQDSTPVSWKSILSKRIQELRGSYGRKETSPPNGPAKEQPKPKSQKSKNVAEETGSTDGAVSAEQQKAGIWTSLRSRMQSNATESGPAEGYGDIIHEGGPTFIEDEATPSKKGSGTKTKRARAAKVVLDVKMIRPQRLRLRPVEEDGKVQVPQLFYNLDRVLFNPGVYHMQDHCSRVFNFDPYLASIMPVDEFDFDALKTYITSSKDVKLRQLSAKHGMKYCGSTSSMTSILSHFHFLLSAWRKPSFDNLSRSLEAESLNFTALSRGPAAAFARFQEGVYAIDADKEYDTENILSMLGKSMEKLFTLPKDEFERYRRTRSHQISEEERNAEESYHYTTLGDFMMRSQLDAYDPRLPGSGMFDLKTRAVVSIRMDVRGYEKGVGYEIRKPFGQWESFEREYYDMIRAAFLKYSLQVRMGRMDGIFVAFHNTQRIFGFQYISLSEMDHAIHGTPDRRIGDQEFKSSVSLLNDLMNRATKRFPGRTLRLHVETRPTKVPLTYFFVEPVDEDEMARIQEAGKPSVEQLEREIRGLSHEEREAESAQEEENAQAHQQQQQPEDSDKPAEDTTANDPQSDAAWKDMMAKVEDSVEDESLGIRSVREAVQDALEQSGLLSDKTELESEKYVDDLVAALTAHSSNSKEPRVSTGEKDDNKAHREGPEPKPAPATERSQTESASLTDLILKVTEGIDDNRHNLKPFQRMFAELATQSKKVEAATEDQPAKAGMDGSADTVEQESATEDAEQASDAQGEKEPELLGMYVTIRNRVNGQFVERPSSPEKEFDWAIQYAITELPDKRAQRIYSKIKKRRKTILSQDPNARSADWYRMFKGNLPIITKKGEKYRERRTQQDARNPVYVAWDTKPQSPESPILTATGSAKGE